MRRLRVRSLYHREHIKKLRRLQRSGQAYVARWATILLLSHHGRSVQDIAAGMGLHVQTVRTRIRTFNGAERAARWGLLRPPRRPGRPPTYGPAVQQGVVDLLKQSPEQLGIDSGVWRLHDLVTVAKRTGLVTGPARRTFNVETVRRLLRKAGYIYLSAKWWITSDDPHYQHKKARRDAILAWAKRDPSILVMFQDESWFSGTPKAVGQYGQRGQPRMAAVAKPAHKCKGAWVLYAALEVVSGQVQRYYAPRCNQTYVRQQLEALLAQAQAADKRVLVVIWDNASWHTAKALRRWYYRYNQVAKRTGQVRLLLVALPSRSPWLNPLEPIFGQAKRRIVGRRTIPQPGRLKRKTEGYFKRRQTRLARKAVHAATRP
jgi:transposase